MSYRIRIDGIYDQRTLKHLKQTEVRDFCFDFSPRSFNFVQEYVFLEQLIPLLTERDRIFVHFNRSNDPMVKKLAEDLSKNGVEPGRLYFEFDEWSPDVNAQEFEYNYLLLFSGDQNVSKSMGKNFCGFVFEFSFLEDLFHKKILQTFASNFYTRFGARMTESHFCILKMQWQSNLLTSLFELFEFNLLSMPISAEIEVCYRNVDLKKLSNEMAILKKNKLISQGL